MLNQAAALEAVAQTPPRFERVDREEPGRRALEEFVRGRYWEAHGSRACHFLDDLFVLRGETSRPLATLGIGLASRGPLFLESYLDRPVEETISSLRGRETRRSEIAEIGTLVSTAPRAGTTLIALAISWLLGREVREGVFTATRQVRWLLRRFGLSCVELAPANPERLDGRELEWGRYYENDPRVLVASFEDAHRVLGRLPKETALLGAAAYLEGTRARDRARRTGP